MSTLRSSTLFLVFAAPLVFSAACGRIGFGDDEELDAGLDVGPDAGDLADSGMDAAVGPFCGNMVVEPPEECDPVVFSPGLGCETNCSASFSFTGDVEFVASSPPNLTPGVVESDTIMLIAERIDETLAADLPIDAFTPGTISATTDEGGVLRAGAKVHVYLIHQDVLASLLPITGTVTFPFDIVGLILQHGSLIATDLPTVTYSPSAARTTEDPVDVVVLGPRTLDLTLFNSSHPDEIRVVVATEEMHGITVEVP